MFIEGQVFRLAVRWTDDLALELWFLSFKRKGQKKERFKIQSVIPAKAGTSSLTN